MQKQNGSMPRNPEDIPCGGMPTYREIVHTLTRLRSISTWECEKILAVHRLIIHISEDELPKYRNNPRGEEEDNVDLRVLYSLHELEEERFCQKLQQREKSLEKRRDILEVLQLIVQVASDNFREAVSVQSFSSCIANVTGLFEYANQALQKISRSYSCVVPQVNTISFQIVTERAN